LYKAVPRNATLGSFAALLKPVSSEPREPKPTKTTVEIDELREIAKAEGLSDGRQQGYAEGLQIGQADGFAAGEAKAYEEAAAIKQIELDALRASFEGVMNGAAEAMDDWYRRSEPGLAQLAVLIATRILARELKITPDSVLAMTREAVAEVTHAKSARIRVNPADADVLTENRATMISASPSLRELEIIGDPEILAGCVIESEGGVVESVLDTQIQEVLDGIRSAA
jgi:flagellar assembly protein FliH